MPLDVILGKPPRMTRDVTPRRAALAAARTCRMSTCSDAAYRVLQFPAVADKTFLVTIGDRTVGGLCARDPMVGPWQVPVADVAVTLRDFTGYAGEAMAIGERTPLALIDAPAAGRMAVGEAITNIAAAGVRELCDVKLSANWMAAAGEPGEDAALYDTVRAVALDLCIALGLSIPVGKDSLSMRTTWRDGDVDKAVTAPVSLIVSAFASIDDARECLTPLLRLDQGETTLVHLDIANGRRRLGASALAQVYGQLGNDAPDVEAIRVAPLFLRWCSGCVPSDACSRTTTSATAAYSRRWPRWRSRRAAVSRYRLSGTVDDALAILFAEELGAVVQVRAGDVDIVCSQAREAGIAATLIATPVRGNRVTVRCGATMVLDESRSDLHRAWSATTHAMQRMRDNPLAADEEYARLLDDDEPGLVPKLTFDPDEDVAAPFIATGVRPRVACCASRA